MKNLTKKEKSSFKQKEQAEAEACTFLDMTTLKEVRSDDSEELSTDEEEFLPIQKVTGPPRNELLMKIWCVGKYFLWVPMLAITLLIIRLTGSSILCDDSEFLFPSHKDTPTPNVPAATTAAKTESNIPAAPATVPVSGSVAADCIPHGYGFDLTLETDSLASMYEIQLRDESDDFFAYSMTSTTEKFEVLDLQSGTKYIVRYRSRHGDKWEDFEKQQKVYCITSSVDETVIRRFLALSYTQTSMTLQWQPPKKGGVKSYELYKNGQKVDTSKDNQMTVAGLDVGKRYQFQVKAQFKDRSSGSMSEKFEFLIPRRSFTDVYRNSDEVDFLRDRNSANAEGFVSELASQSKSSAKKIITKYCLKVDGFKADSWADCNSGQCTCKDNQCSSVGQKDLEDGLSFSTPKQIECIDKQLGKGCAWKASSMQYMVQYADLEKAGFKYEQNKISSNKNLLDKVFQDKILRCCGC